MSEQFKVWWSTLSEREQQLSVLGVIFLLLMVVYWAAWKPLNNQLAENKAQLERAQQTLVWVEDKTALLVKLGVGKQPFDREKITLGQIVNMSAKQYGISFSRVDNKKDQIAVWISDVEFDHFISWLTALNHDSFVSVVAADFSKLPQEGHIKVNRLLLAN